MVDLEEGIAGTESPGVFLVQFRGHYPGKRASHGGKAKAVEPQVTPTLLALLICSWMRPTTRHGSCSGLWMSRRSTARTFKCSWSIFSPGAPQAPKTAEMGRGRAGSCPASETGQTFTKARALVKGRNRGGSILDRKGHGGRKPGKEIGGVRPAGPPRNVPVTNGRKKH